MSALVACWGFPRTYHKLADIGCGIIQRRRILRIIAISPKPSNSLPPFKSNSIKPLFPQTLKRSESRWAWNLNRVSNLMTNKYITDLPVPTIATVTFSIVAWFDKRTTVACFNLPRFKKSM